MIFIKLPVADLSRSRDFYGHLGFTFNEAFSDERSTAVVVEETIVVQLTTGAAPDDAPVGATDHAERETSVVYALAVDGRDAVDELAEKATAAGASVTSPEDNDPAVYRRAFTDPDGHLWELLYLEPRHVLD